MWRDSLKSECLELSVDLFEEKALKNPFLKQSIDQLKRQVYGQQCNNLTQEY
jgi:hypothetical protein